MFKTSHKWYNQSHGMWEIILSNERQLPLHGSGRISSHSGYEFWSQNSFAELSINKFGHFLYYMEENVFKKNLKWYKEISPVQA